MSRETHAADSTRQDLEDRLKREERVNPSGHGEQATPHQQRETAESAEHDDDRARAWIDPATLRDLDEGTSD